jgi:hypothetical protein
MERVQLTLNELARNTRAQVVSYPNRRGVRAVTSSKSVLDEKLAKARQPGGEAGFVDGLTWFETEVLEQEHVPEFTHANQLDGSLVEWLRWKRGSDPRVARHPQGFTLTFERNVEVNPHQRPPTVHFLRREVTNRAARKDGAHDRP